MMHNNPPTQPSNRFTMAIKIKTTSTFGALVIVATILAMAAGWCMNIYTIATSPEIFPLTGMMILRIVGIFVAPLGGVIGYF